MEKKQKKENKKVTRILVTNMPKLDPEKEKWNQRLEEQYQKDKAKEKIEKKKKIIELPEVNSNTFKNKQIKSYRQLKKRFNEVDDSETISKWKILSKAYKLGKEIYGQQFSVVKLSHDFEIPYTTCKRVLSLDRANKRTWKLIKEKKISAFKVAQVCMTKNIKYQDQIIDLVVHQNLSTTDIKNLRTTKDGIDVKAARLEKAVKQGFSRKDSAFKSIKDTTLRMIRLLDIPAHEFPESKISEIIGLLDELQVKTNKKLEELITNGKR